MIVAVATAMPFALLGNQVRRALSVATLSVLAAGCGDDAPPGGEGGRGGGAGVAGAATGGSAGVAGSAGGQPGGEGGDASGGTAGSGAGGRSGSGSGGAGEAGEGGAGEAGEGGAGEAGEGGADDGGAATGGSAMGGTAGDGGCSGDCCVRVAPDGDDAIALGNRALTPFRNVQPAIDFAHSHASTGGRVCVAAGPSCADAASYSGPPAADFRMRNGVSVYGGYEQTGWTRCSPLAAVTLEPTTASGVSFGADIVQATALDGFTVQPAAAETTAAVSVRGAVGAELGSLLVVLPDPDEPPPSSFHGVDVSDGANATISTSRIEVQADVDFGPLDAVGVRSVGARITADIVVDMDVDSGTAVGIWLEDSPNSQVMADVVVSGSVVTGVRVAGDGDGVEIRESSIDAMGGGSSLAVAVELLDCAGAEPVIANNDSIVAQAGREAVDAIRALGDCHPRIEANDLIAALASNSPRTTAIRCGAAGGRPSRCSIVDNAEIRTSNPRTMPGPDTVGVGIACEAGSCAEIRGNDVTGLFVPNAGCSRSCQYDAYGLILEDTDALVQRNVIRSGHGDRSAGIRAEGATSRVENNFVFGRPNDALGPDGVTSSVGILSIDSALDVHSNTIDGGGVTTR